MTMTMTTIHLERVGMSLREALADLEGGWAPTRQLWTREWAVGEVRVWGQRLEREMVALRALLARVRDLTTADGRASWHDEQEADALLALEWSADLAARAALAII